MTNANNENSRSSTDDSARQRSTRYPRHSLEKAEEFAHIAFNVGPRNCDIDRVAQAAGYKNAQNGAFAALRGTASAFGLIRNQSGNISVAESWIKAFHSEDQRLIQEERQKAVQSPSLYQQIFQDYEGRQLPSVEKLARALHLDQKYGILKDAAAQAAQVFMESVAYAGLIDSKGFLRDAVNLDSDQGAEPEIPQQGFEQNQVTQFRSSNTVPRLPDFPPGSEELDRIEIKLRNGMKAYLYVPVPLPYGEKERIKKYIDLLLEEDNPRSRSGDEDPEF